MIEGIGLSPRRGLTRRQPRVDETSGWIRSHHKVPTHVASRNISSSDSESDSPRALVLNNALSSKLQSSSFKTSGRIL